MIPDMSLTAVLYAVAFCAVLIVVALLIQWGLRFLGAPEEPSRYVMIIVWIIVGVSCIVRLMRLAGIA